MTSGYSVRLRRPISEREQQIYFENLQQSFDFDLGEAIHVENSYKYSDKDILVLAKSAGFCVIQNLDDKRKMFTDSIWKVKKPEDEREDE